MIKLEKKCQTKKKFGDRSNVKTGIKIPDKGLKDRIDDRTGVEGPDKGLADRRDDQNKNTRQRFGR